MQFIIIATDIGEHEIQFIFGPIEAADSVEALKIFDASSALEALSEEACDNLDFNIHKLTPIKNK